MKVKIIEHTEHITDNIKNIYWVVYIDDVIVKKFNTYIKALNYSIQTYGHSAVFPT